MSNNAISSSIEIVHDDKIAIKNLIYLIRNQQVMLDSDLAELYQVETGRLNEAVKRNIKRFPEGFRFQLSKNEYENLISQIAISSLDNKSANYGGRRKMPYVYTEHGIAMLSVILRSDIAISVSVRIINSFVEMRKYFNTFYMANTSIINERLNNMEVRQIAFREETDERFEKVFDYIATHEESNQKVFFDGQIYDAFSLIADLIKKADNEIILIDNYVALETLNLLSKKKSGVPVNIYTQKNTPLNKIDVANFNKQYPLLSMYYTGAFHDRFLILDGKIAYHIGASIKDAGKKCFGINFIQDAGIIKDILSR
jgi:hypothetical protein